MNEIELLNSNFNTIRQVYSPNFSLFPQMPRTYVLAALFGLLITGPLVFFLSSEGLPTVSGTSPGEYYLQCQILGYFFTATLIVFQNQRNVTSCSKILIFIVSIVLSAFGVYVVRLAFDFVLRCPCERSPDGWVYPLTYSIVCFLIQVFIALWIEAKRLETT